MPSPTENLLLALLIGPWLAGCGILERAACGEPCTGKPIPVEGSPDDFTRNEDPRSGVEASPVARCQDNDDAMFVLASTDGEDADVEAWVSARLLPALNAAEIRTSWNAVQCESFDRPAYNVLDWREVDAVIDLLGELAEEDGVSIQLAITVGPEPVACPSIACGV